MPNRIVQDTGRAALERLVRTLEVLGRNPGVTVGVHAQDTDRSDDTLNNATLMAIHEFGLGVPQRAVFRPVLDENRAEYDQMRIQLLGQVLDGRMSVERLLSLLGRRVVGDIQARFGDTSELKENADSTIRQKGSASPLIDDGHLRRSLDYVVHESLD